MKPFYLFKNGNNWICGSDPVLDIIPSGSFRLTPSGVMTVTLLPIVEGVDKIEIKISEVCKNAKGEKYTSAIDFVAGTDGFFVKASGDGGTSAVLSVNGLTGNVSITKYSIGLSNVDDTSDSNKPVSIAQALANQKVFDDLISELSNYVNKNKVGVNGGIAELDASGKVPVSQLPNINAEVVSKPDKSSRLAIPTNSTNMVLCLQADTKWMWAINKGVDPSVEANWIDCGSTAAAVISINGATGAITITKSTIGLENVDNTSDLNKPISTATQAALNNITTILNNKVDLTTANNNYVAKAAGFSLVSDADYAKTKALALAGA